MSPDKNEKQQDVTETKSDAGAPLRYLKQKRKAVATWLRRNSRKRRYVAVEVIDDTVISIFVRAGKRITEKSLIDEDGSFFGVVVFKEKMNKPAGIPDHAVVVEWRELQGDRLKSIDEGITMMKAIRKEESR